jgi:hypothetical protein
MNKDEIFYKNSVLGFEFDKYLIEHPELSAKIPNNALIVILPQDDPELCKINLKLSEDLRERNQPVLYVRVGKIAPPRKSRLVKPKLELKVA